MSVVLALSKCAASFRFGGAAARLMSVKGGSILESESDKIFYSLGLKIAKQVRGPVFKHYLTNRLLLAGRSISESLSDPVLYSVGIDMAKEVGSQVKPHFTKEELNTVMLGYTDSGTATQDQLFQASNRV